jgi:hypothetical protein
MKLKLKIFNSYGRKVFCISLVLLFGLYFSAGAAVAKGCDGGFGCPVCDGSMHPHLPAKNMNMAPNGNGCLPLEQNNACSSEIGSDSDMFHGIVPTVRTDRSDVGDSFSLTAVGHTPAGAADQFIPQSLYSDTQPTTPIYIFIHTLLC